MNKRQHKKNLKKQLAPFLGKLFTMENMAKMAVIGSSYIRDQLSRSSPLRGLFTILKPLKPPIRRWMDSEGLVHQTGIRDVERYNQEGGPVPCYERRTACDRGLLNVKLVETVEEADVVDHDGIVTCMGCIGEGR